MSERKGGAAISNRRSSPRNQRQEQAAETRRKLLDAAKALFAENGYHATPVRAINRAVQMGDGILYHHFPGGKREIFAVLVRESFERRSEELRLMNSEIADMPLPEALEAVYTRFNRLFLADLDLMRIVFRESDVVDLEEAARLKELMKERMGLFADFLKRRHEAGEIRRMNFALAAKQFLALSVQPLFGKLTGLALQHDVDPEAAKKEALEHTLNLWSKH